MRRLLAAALLAGALLAGAACTSDSPPETSATAGPGPAGGVPGTGASPSTSPAPTAGTATVTENGKRVCAAARKLTTEKVSAFVTQLSRSLQAQVAGDAKGAAQAKAAAEKSIREWAAGLRTQAAEAEDANLKALLSEMSAFAAQMTADLQTIDDAKLADLQQRLEALCGT